MTTTLTLSVLDYFGISKNDVDQIASGQANYSFKLKEVSNRNKKSLLVYMTPHSRFPYGAKKDSQLAAVNDMWNRVRTFISDNNLQVNSHDNNAEIFKHY